jgi:hypothetical protein
MNSRLNRIVTAALLCTLIQVTACTAKYEVSNLGGQEAHIHLDRTAMVYIAVPEDGQFESKSVGGSGQIVAQALGEGFGKRAAKVRIADKYQSRENVLEDARAVGAAYVIVPTIANWEQRATEWSGRPSRLLIRVAVVDAKSAEQLSNTSIEGRSRIMSMTSTSPESLLRDPIESFASSLY